MEYKPEDREKVLELFLNEKDNRVETIMKKTGYGIGFVNGTINKYLMDKMENK